MTFAYLVLAIILWCMTSVVVCLALGAAFRLGSRNDTPDDLVDQIAHGDHIKLPEIPVFHDRKLDL